jgi:hypothetical protein
MASISGDNPKTYSKSLAACNVNCSVKITDLTATRANSGNSTSVTLKFKVAVKTPDDYTQNSIKVWVDEAGGKLVFDSNNGANKTSKTKWYTTSEYSITKTVARDATTTSFKVSLCCKDWSPTLSEAASKTYSVTGISKGKWAVTFNLNGGTGGPATNPVLVTDGNTINPHNYALPSATDKVYNEVIHWAASNSSTAKASTSYTITAAKTFYAVRQKTINVTYSVPSGWSNKPANTTLTPKYTQNGTHHMASYTVSSTVPTHSLKSFANWSYSHKTYDTSAESSTAKSGTVAAGGTLSNISAHANVTLTLNESATTWKKYTLTLDGVNFDNTYTVSGNSTSPTSVSVDTNSNVNKVFAGWYVGNTQIFNASGAKVTGNSYWDSSGKWCYGGNVTATAKWNDKGMGAGPIRFGNDYKVYAAKFTSGNSNIQLLTNYEIKAKAFTKHNKNEIILSKDGTIYAKDFIIQ